MALEIKDGSMSVNPAAFTFVNREIPTTTTVGRDTLAWLDHAVSLVTKRIATSPVCTVANAVETNRNLRALYSEMSDDQRAMARAVFEFEAINFMSLSFRPDQGLVNPEGYTPEIFRVNHTMGEESIAVFFTRAKGLMEDSRFFLVGASRMDQADMVLAELAKYGYVDKGKNSARNVVLMAA